MNKLKTNFGITLIALVITIIVMLILVAVTISMAVNGGLFQYAGNAASKTNEAIEQEKTLGDAPSNLTTEELIDYYKGPSGYGLSTDGKTFVGKKSIGIAQEGVEDNSQKTNWDDSKNGYVFPEGHFIEKKNQVYYTYNKQTSSWNIQQRGDVYLCWDQENVDPAYREITVGNWDIFSPEGEFLSKTGYGRN